MLACVYIALHVCTLVIVIWSLTIILFITNNKHLQYNNIVDLWTQWK